MVVGKRWKRISFWEAAYFAGGNKSTETIRFIDPRLPAPSPQRSSGRASCHKSYSNQMLIHHELLGTWKSENDVKIHVFDFLTNQYFGLLVGI